MKRWKRAVLAVLALSSTAGIIAIAGCEKSLPPSYLLTDPRVLAVRSEPVELAPGGQVTLDALVYAPPGSPAPTYEWSWCATVGSTLQCATTSAALVAILDPEGTSGVTIDYALGSSNQAVLAYPADPALIRSACTRRRGDAGVDEAGTDLDGGDAGDGDDGGDAAIDNDAGDGGNGGPRALACSTTSWTVYVLLTVTVGGKTMQATRTLAIDLDPPTSANTNPTILGVAPFTDLSTFDASALGDPGAQADGGEVDAAAGALDNGGLRIVAEVPTTAADIYAARFFSDAGANEAGLPPDTPDGALGYEALDLAWYVEKGTLDRTSSVLPPTAIGTPRDWSSLLSNRWVPPSQPGSSDIIVVVRDNRGGIGWVRQTAKTP